MKCKQMRMAHEGWKTWNQRTTTMLHRFTTTTNNNTYNFYSSFHSTQRRLNNLLNKDFILSLKPFLSIEYLTIKCKCNSHGSHSNQGVKSIKLLLFNSIQFILYSPLLQNTNFPQRALQSVHIRHPWPLTSHRIRKNSQEIEKILSRGKKWRTLQESNRGGSLSRMRQIKTSFIADNCHDPEFLCLILKSMSLVSSVSLHFLSLWWSALVLIVSSCVIPATSVTITRYEVVMTKRRYLASWKCWRCSVIGCFLPLWASGVACLLLQGCSFYLVYRAANRSDPSTSRISWTCWAVRHVHSAQHQPIGLRLGHFELITRQNPNCLLSWLLIGGTSSPLTPGRQEVSSTSNGN